MIIAQSIASGKYLSWIWKKGINSKACSLFSSFDYTIPII